MKFNYSLIIIAGERLDVVVEALSKGLYWFEVQGFQDCSDLVQYAVMDSNIAAIINETIAKAEMNSSVLQKNIRLPLETPLSLKIGSEVCS